MKEKIALHQFKLVRVDDKGKRYVLKSDEKPDGSEFILAYLPPPEGSNQAKNGEKRRIFLKDQQGNKIPAKSFTHYSNGNRREPGPTRKLINQAIEAMNKSNGYDPEKTALDNAAAIRQEKRRVQSMFNNFIVDYRETPNKRTLKKRSSKTVAEMEVAFGWFVKLFGNFTVDQFPKNVAEQFQLKLASQPARPGSVKTMSPQNIRKHGIALHQFFGWLLDNGHIQKQIKLDLPSQTLAPAPVPMTNEDMGKVTAEIDRKIAEAELKPGKKGHRMSEADQYRNHKRAWLMMVHCGLRLAEVWSLRIENILLEQGSVFIPAAIDMDGGKDRYGNSFKVQFNSKSGVDEQCGIGAVARDFLNWDLDGLDEGWLLRRPDGSNAFASPEALGKAIERHQKSAGISGKAKRCQGVRIAVATNMGEKNIYLAQQQLRHKEVSTTLRSYAAKTPEAVKSELDRVSNLHTGIVN